MPFSLSQSSVFFIYTVPASCAVGCSIPAGVNAQPVGQDDRDHRGGGAGHPAAQDGHQPEAALCHVDGRSLQVYLMFPIFFCRR